MSVYSQPLRRDATKLTAVEQKQFHTRMLNIFVRNNYPFSTLRNFKEWRELFEFANPVLVKQITTVQRLNTLLEKNSRSVDRLLLDELRSRQYTATNLLIDGWSSASHSHLLGIVVSREDADWSSNKE